MRENPVFSRVLMKNVRVNLVGPIIHCSPDLTRVKIMLNAVKKYNTKGEFEMKKCVCYLLKCSVAAFISIVILSLFSLVYYNPPMATVQPDLVTNSKFVPNTKWSYMTEGFGYGFVNDQGYNNAYYEDCSDPDVVFIGSSHLEAIQVPEDANCVYLLNEKFDKDDLFNNDFKCLNLGISGHFFEVSASNFEYVVNTYKDAKYIVIEASNIEFSSSKLDDIINCKFHHPLNERGFLYNTLQKVPYLRLIYKKINEINQADNSIVNSEASQLSEDNDINIYSDKMHVILERILNLSEANGIEPIILMHERFFVDTDGNIVMRNDPAYKSAFKKCCKKVGIKVVDVSPAMIDHYKKTSAFSYGFSNSVPGKGHLNKIGHKIIADVLYDRINEMEGNK